MSALTKTFVVLLVVMALLLSSGVIVLAGHLDNFRTQMSTQAKKIDQLTVDKNRANSLVSSLEANLNAATRDRDAALADSQKLFLANQQAELTAAGRLADENSKELALTTSVNTTTAALATSETAKVAQAGIITSTRTANDDLKSKNSDLNLRVSDLTNKLDVVTRQFTNATEQLAQVRAENAQYAQTNKDNGGKALGADQVHLDTGIGSPSITGKVIRTDTQNNTQYATISVGSKDQVTKGMKFQLIDRAAVKYLGELVVESVDESQATGKIEGPAIADVRPDTEARTQL